MNQKNRGSLRIFSRKTGELEQKVDSGIQAAFIDDGRFLAIITRNGFEQSLIVRDVHGKKNVAETPLGRDSFPWLHGQYLVACDYNGPRITVRNLGPGTRLKKSESDKLPYPLMIPGGVAISPAGNLIAAIDTAKPTIILYDIDQGMKVTHKLEGYLDGVNCVAFSPTGEFIVSSAEDKTIRFWNVKQGNQVLDFKNVPASISELIFSANGKRIAVVCLDKRKPRKAEIRRVELKSK